MGNRVREKHQLNGCLESLEYGKLSRLCKDDTAHIMFFFPAGTYRLKHL